MSVHPFLYFLKSEDLDLFNA